MLQRDGEIRRHGGFADTALAAGDRDDVFDALDARRAHSRRACARGRRVDIDQDFDLRHAGHAFQRLLCFCLDRAWNGGLVRCQRHLHGDRAISDLDAFDESEGNDIAAEAGIFDRFECFFDLFFCDRHE